MPSFIESIKIKIKIEVQSLAKFLLKNIFNEFRYHQTWPSCVRDDETSKSIEKKKHEPS